MPVIFVLLSVLAAAGLALFVLRIRGEHSARPDEQEEHFVGSGTWCSDGGKPKRASWPLVRLDIVPSGMVIGPTSRWWRWVVPQVEMRWADIAYVESRPTGVRINLRGADDQALLFQLHRDEVLAALGPHPIELRR
jgi:hypothetical protein